MDRPNPGTRALFRCSAFSIRRHTLEYHLEHTFAISVLEFFGSALALSDPVPIESNAIEVLQNGDEYFPAMLEAIRTAKKTINFEAYIVYSDEVGRAFCEALSERARAGVEVRVLLDGVGSGWSLNNSDVRMMKRAGCDFTYYHPTIPALTAAGNIKAQIVSSHSFSIAPIPLVQAVAFAAANKRIWITNAYCTPTSDQVELLTKAARRGVDVRILVPGQNNDQPLTKSAGRGAYGKLLEGGVKIF